MTPTTLQKPAVKTAASHGPGRLMGLVGLAAGGALMLVLPRLSAVSGTALEALARAVGTVVIIGALATFVPGSLLARVRSRASDARGYDFGWSWIAYAGPFLGAAALASAALGLGRQWPDLWPLWCLVGLLGVSTFVGGLVLRTSNRPDYTSLPLVDLLRSDEDLVLDAGCGGGRTTIELSKVLRRGRIVAVDRFDASYIDGGGKELLERNLRIAGLLDRIRVERGDLTALPFADQTFHSAVSAHVVDHIKDKPAALAELLRVLKPGGRLLVVVWVPSWATFALANVLCLLLSSKARWRKMAERAGFVLKDEGMLNGNWFALLERPVEGAQEGSK